MRAIYRDRNGTVETVMKNDGKTLTLMLRGVEFKGRDFDSLSPDATTDCSLLSPFTLNNGELCACRLEVEFPLKVSVGGQSVQGMLLTHLELGKSRPDGGLNRERLILKLSINNQQYRSSGHSGWFEDEMLDIQRQLPTGTSIMACITCAYSDYSPFGHGMFGDLACFRNDKDGYSSVRSKADLFDIWDKKAEFVQETYVCAEFERRAPGTGYRG